MSLQPKPRPSFDDWLANERTSLDEHHESVDGEVFAMSGGAFEHNAIIIGNFVRELGTPMTGRPH